MRYSIFFLLSLSLGAPAAAADACSGSRTLLITDSHGVFGEFGPTLQGWLQSRPRSEVDTYAFGGSAPMSFFVGATSKCAYVDHACDGSPPKPRSCATIQAPVLSTILPIPAGIDGQTVVVALGTNQLLDKPDYVVSVITKMASEILASKSTCAWVGPPKMRRFSEDLVDRYYALLAQALDAAAKQAPDSIPCALIDSRPLTDYPAGIGDGVHYSFTGASPADRSRGDAAARAWADGVIQELKRILIP